MSCVTYCAYHNTMLRNEGSSKYPYVYYGVIPDQGGGCAWGCGGDTIPFNNLCLVTSHELAEAVTDPGVGQCYDYASSLAWYSSTHGEIGDICSGIPGTTLGADGNIYTVQKQWSNNYNNCIDNTPLTSLKKVTRSRKPVSTPSKQ
jgi:hypothetical protein